MFNYLKSLRAILSKADFNKLLSMSLILTIVALIEVGGLAAIAFLILNLENLNSALVEIKIFNHLLTSLGLSENKTLFLFSILIIIYSLLTIIVSTVSIKRISIFCELMGAKIKTKLLQHFLKLNWLEFSRSKSSKNMSRIINDGDIVADMMNFFMNLFNKFILALIIAIALFFFNPLLTFGIAIILSAAYFLIFLVFKKRVRKNSLEITRLMDATLNIVTNIFGSFKEIIFYNNQKQVVSNFENIDSNLANLKGVNMSWSYMPRFYIDAALLLMLVLASIFVSYNDLSTSSFFATLSVYGLAALKLLPASQNIFYFSYEIYSRMPHLNNVCALLASDYKNEFLNPQDKLPFFNKEISFSNISFNYRKNKTQPLLSKINLKITKGQKIAIVGPTGSGKSTFLDLLLGMIEPDSGQITVDDIALSKENIHSYRKNFAYVPQKIFFLEDTLLKNITFGSTSDLDANKLNKAILNSSLKRIINNLPQGIETNISDTNQMVSGGQKQCIGIARALYRGGDILVLDEATSGMDQALEKKIYENIFNSNFKSFICVTHRMSLLNTFDHILVFNEGKIEAAGHYNELLRTSKFFNSLVESSID